MKKLFIISILVTALACSKDDDSGSDNNPGNNDGGNNDQGCGTLSGYTLYRDSEGCYYNGTYGTKVYVDSDACTCD